MIETPPPSRRPGWRRWVQWILALGLLIWLLRSIQLADAAAVFRHGLASPVWLLAGFLATALAYGCAWSRWHGLLYHLGLRWPARSTLRAFLTSLTLSTVLPGAHGGDAYRGWWAFTQAGSTNRTEALGSVVLDRLFGLGAAGGWAWAASLLYARTPGTTPLHTGGPWMGWAGLFGFLGFLFFVFRRPRTGTSKRTGRFATGVSRGLEIMRTVGRSPGIWGRGVGLSLAVQGFRILACVAYGRALGMDLPIGTYALLVPLILMAVLIPLTPGGVGIRENLFVWMFGWEGVEPETALCLSLLVYLGNVGMGLPGLALLSRSSAEKA